MPAPVRSDRLSGAHGLHDSTADTKARCRRIGTRAAPQPATAPSAAQSEALRAYYAQVQASLLTQGLLRGDGGGPDTPFDADTLVRNFQTIALFEEYATVGGRIVARQTASRLHRWDMPVRIECRIRRRDPARCATPRPPRDRTLCDPPLAGHWTIPFPSPTASRISTFSLSTNGRAAPSGRDLGEIIPGIDAASISAVTDLPRSTYCLVFACDPGDDGTYAKAVAVIRAEHPDMLRLSCIHEEMAQGLGLSNDSPKARPSIFNDDEEFGLLTSHDEALLSMLYDPRLQTRHDRRRSRAHRPPDRGRKDGRTFSLDTKETSHGHFRFSLRRIHRRHPLDR